ncbi:MAG: LamG domain-containing protein, partial [Armatimonadetes bacterium]|nr:LamG domain-containing protein [Armatimonadota bacterium]
MPACLLCLLLALPALAAPPTAPYQPDADTVLLWHFDDAAAASAVDSSPAGDHPGTVTGATTVEGRFGRALRWSEETGQVVARGDLRLDDSFTVEAWVRLDKLPTGQPPFWAADVLGKLASFFIAIRPPGVLYVGLQVGAQTNWLSGQTVLPVGEWAHLALVYDGPASKAGVYVNGHRDTEFDLVLGSDRRLHHSDSPFFLRSYSGGDEKLVGAIDEVRLLARAETFGQPWSSAAYLHPLRYRAAFLVGARLSPSPAGAAQELRFSLAEPSGRELIGQRLT